MKTQHEGCPIVQKKLPIKEVNKITNAKAHAALKTQSQHTSNASKSNSDKHSAGQRKKLNAQRKIAGRGVPPEVDTELPTEIVEPINNGEIKSAMLTLNRNPTKGHFFIFCSMEPYGTNITSTNVLKRPYNQDMKVNEFNKALSKDASSMKEFLSEKRFKNVTAIASEQSIDEHAGDLLTLRTLETRLGMMLAVTNTSSDHDVIFGFIGHGDSTNLFVFDGSHQQVRKKKMSISSMYFIQI